MARFDTMANIWSSAAIQLGVSTQAVANPYAATNPDHLLLNELINELGLYLLAERDWVHLTKEATITTSNGDNDYDLPTDFDRMVLDTHWNRTSDQRLRPVGPQGWQYLQANGIASLPDFYYRLVANEIQFYPTPSGTNDLRYEYVSRYWARATASAAPDKEACTVSTDVIHYDRSLMVAGLKWFWRRNKGFDASAAQSEFLEALEAAGSKDDAPRILHLNGGDGEPHLLDDHNIPERDWG